MIGAAPAWAVWLALGLWGLAGIVVAVALVLARRLWRQLSPAVLGMMEAASTLGAVGAMMDAAMLATSDVEADDDEPSTENAWRHERGA